MIKAKEEFALTISYNKLWKLLIDKGMNKTELGKESGVSSSTIAKLSKNEQISMDSMLKICNAINCNIGDIIDIVKKSDQNKSSLETNQEEEQEM